MITRSFITRQEDFNILKDSLACLIQMLSECFVTNALPDAPVLLGRALSFRRLDQQIIHNASKYGNGISQHDQYFLAVGYQGSSILQKNGFLNQIFKSEESLGWLHAERMFLSLVSWVLPRTDQTVLRFSDGTLIPEKSFKSIFLCPS
jgi:hypothetical protein